MIMTLSLALRNLMRNRRRSLATLLALAIGSTATLLFGGFSANINYMMHTHQVRLGGHIQIQHRDFYLYGNGNPTAYGISNYIDLIETINRDPELGKMALVVTPTMQFGGIAGNYAAGVSRTVIGNGFVASDINRMWLWNDFRVATPVKRFALDGAPPDSAVVGLGLARVLQLCRAFQIERCPEPEKTQQTSVDSGKIPDDIAQLSLQETSTKSTRPLKPTASDEQRIEVLIGNARGAPNVTSLKVIRAEEQVFKELDEVYVMMHLDQLQKLVYGRAKAKVTSIMLQLRHSNQIPQAIERLGPILKKYSVDQPLVVLDFRELNPFYVQTVAMFDTIFGFIFILIGAIVLFTVSNTMNTAVIERTIEIGTLRAIGLRRAGIRALFVTEGALLGMAGALLGVLLALTLSELVNSMGLTWLPPANVEPVPLMLTVWGETKMIIGTALGLMLIAVASAWWPAYRAANLNVVDALRHV